MRGKSEHTELVDLSQSKSNSVLPASGEIEESKPKYTWRELGEVLNRE
jgi:hypothetical protein